MNTLFKYSVQYWCFHTRLGATFSAVNDSVFVMFIKILRYFCYFTFIFELFKNAKNEIKPKKTQDLKVP